MLLSRCAKLNTTGQLAFTESVNAFCAHRLERDRSVKCSKAGVQSADINIYKKEKMFATILRLPARSSLCCDGYYF